MIPRQTHALVLLLTLAAASTGQTPDAPLGEPPPTQETRPQDPDVQRILRRMAELEAEVADLRARLEASEGGAATQQLRTELEAALAELRQKLESGAISGRIEPATQQTIGWTTRFARRSGAGVYVGGYFDSELRFVEASNQAFDQHRLVPFLEGRVTDRILFATEVEIEHGGEGNNRDDGEIKVEFATLDLLFEDELNFRTGIILTPLGRLNVLHDSPLLDLTDRPLMHRTLIPTTLSEAGAGLFGSFDVGEEARLNYEAYVVNGFHGLDAQGNAFIDRTSGLRNARGSQRRNVNDEFAFVYRVGFSPWLGLDVGVSQHIGDYDAEGDNLLAITALDAFWQQGPFELRGEAAHVSIERDGRAKAAGIPDDFWGYYLEGAYHFLPEGMRGKGILEDDATFTAVARWGEVDLDGARRRRLTLGFNLRPTEATVIKLEWQRNMEALDLASVANDAVILSLATYFSR